MIFLPIARKMHGSLSVTTVKPCTGLCLLRRQGKAPPDPALDKVFLFFFLLCLLRKQGKALPDPALDRVACYRFFSNLTLKIFFSALQKIPRQCIILISFWFLIKLFQLMNKRKPNGRFDSCTGGHFMLSTSEECFRWQVSSFLILLRSFVHIEIFEICDLNVLTKGGNILCANDRIADELNY